MTGAVALLDRPSAPNNLLASVGGTMLTEGDPHRESFLSLQRIRVMHGLIGYCGRGIQDALLSDVFEGFLLILASYFDLC